MEGGHVLFRDFGEVKQFGGCRDIRFGSFKYQGGIFKLGDILMAVTQSLNYPGGFQINKHGPIIGGMALAKYPGHIHFKRTGSGRRGRILEPSPFGKIQHHRLYLSFISCEIDKQTDFDAGRFKIIQQLGLRRSLLMRNCFYLDNHEAFNEKVSKILTNDLFLITDLKRGLVRNSPSLSAFVSG